MSFEKVQNPGEQSLGVMFACPTCEAKIAMVTNPGETAMVQALGVKLGGKTAEAQPMALTRGSLKEAPETVQNSVPSAAAQQEMLKAETAKSESTGEGGCPFSGMVAQMGGGDSKESTVELTWTSEAEERAEKIPSFMRPMIKMGVENYARKNGISTITTEVMEASKNDPGDLTWSKEAEQHLDNIPAFVRPMARKEIERMAKERGDSEISSALLEEAKGKFLGMGY
ncbi:PCP reductase family protein [Nitrospira defluvii]|nr:PCP reductase family protein [Nitrospira defluvii]